MANLTIVLDLDDGDLPSKIAAVDTALVKMNASADKAQTGFKGIESHGRSLGTVFRDATVTLGLMGQALDFVKMATTGWASEIVHVNAEFERMTSVMRALSTSATPLTDSVRQVTELREMAKEMPFSLTAVHQAYTRLASAGLDANKTLKATANAVAAFGGGDAELNRAALALQEMSGKGVVQMKELRNQLMMAIPSAGKLLARSFGETYGQMMHDIHTGTVDAKTTIDGLMLEFNRAFGGEAQRQMHTFNGLLGQMSVLWQDIANKQVGKVFSADGTENENGFFGTLKKQVEDFNKFLAGNADGTGVAQGLGTQLGEGMKEVVLDIRAVVDEFIKFHSEIATGAQFAVYAYGLSTIINGFILLVSTVGQAKKAFAGIKDEWNQGLSNNAQRKSDMHAKVATENEYQPVLYAKQQAAEKLAAASAAVNIAGGVELEYQDRMSQQKNAGALARMQDKMNRLKMDFAHKEAEAKRFELELEQATIAADVAISEGAAKRMTGFKPALKGALEFLPAILSGFGAIAIAAPIVGLAIGALGEHFGWFSDRAKEAWQNLEHYGAASRKEAAGGQAYIDGLDAKIAQKERLLANAKKGKLWGREEDGAYDDLANEIARDKANVAEKRKAEIGFNASGANNEASDGVKAKFAAIDASLMERRNKYGRDADKITEAAKPRYEALATAGMSSATLTLETREQLRANNNSLYDDQMKVFEGVREANQKIVDNTKEGSFEQIAALKMVTEAKRRELEVTEERNAANEQSAGLKKIPKEVDDIALYKKAEEELIKIRAASDGVAESIRGGDGATQALVERWRELHKAGDGEQERSKAYYNDIMNANKALKERQEILAGSEKLSKHIADIQIEQQREIFKAQHDGKVSQSDMFQWELDHGVYAGFGGTDPASVRLIEQRRLIQSEGIQATETGAVVNTAFSQMVPAIVTVVDSLKNVVNELTNIRNGVASPFNMTINQSVNGDGGTFTGNKGIPGWWTPERMAHGVSRLVSEAGMTEIGAAGLIARFTQEGGGGPTTVNAKGGATGINQALGDRKPAGYASMSYDEQLSYIINTDLKQSAQAKALSTLRTASTPLEASLGATHYERAELYKESGGKRDVLTYGTPVEKVLASIRGVAGYNSGVAQDAAASNSVVSKQAGLEGDELNANLRKNKRLDDQRLKAEKDRIAKGDADVARAQADEAGRKLTEGLKTKDNKEKFQLNGSGEKLAEAQAWIVEHGKETSKKTNDPNAKAWADTLKLAKDYDTKHDALIAAQKAKTAAESSAEGMSTKLSKAEEERQSKWAEVRRTGTADPDGVVRAREQGKEAITKAEEWQKLHPGADANKGVATAKQEAADLEAKARSESIAEEIIAAKKKNTVLREATMTQAQVEEDKLRMMREKRDRELANWKGTEAEKIDYTKTINEEIALEQSALSSKSPLNKQMHEWADVSKNLEGSVTGFMDGAVDNVVKQIQTGKANWKGFADQVLGDLAKMALKGLMGNMFDGLMGQGDKKKDDSSTGGTGGAIQGGMGLLSKLFGAGGPSGNGSTGGTGGAGKLGGTGGANKAGAGSGIIGSLMGMFGVHHTGGIIGNAPMSRMLPMHEAMSLFHNAPRFHTGGVIGTDEVPIIAKRGEGVFTREQMAAMSNVHGGGHNIALHNNITVNANGGTQDQNEDLARQVGAHVERVARHTVVDELLNQMRPGNMLYTAGNGWNNS